MLLTPNPIIIDLKFALKFKKRTTQISTNTVVYIFPFFIKKLNIFIMFLIILYERKNFLRIFDTDSLSRVSE